MNRDSSALSLSDVLEAVDVLSQKNIRLQVIQPNTKIPFGRPNDSLRAKDSLAYTRKELELAYKEYKQPANIAGFLGNVSKNLVAIDIDNPRKFENFLRLSPPHVQLFYRELLQSAAIYESASAVSERGRMQVLFRTPFPVVSKNLIATSGFEIRGQSKTTGQPSYSVLPPSVAKGKFGQLGMYRWQQWPDEIPEISQFDVNIVKDHFPMVAYEQKAEESPLSRDLWRLLTSEPDNDVDRSYNEARIVYRLVACNWSFLQVKNLFTKNAHAKSKYRERGDGYLFSLYESAATKQKSIQPSSVQLKIIRIKEIMSSVRFSTNNDKLCYLVLLQIAKKANKLQVSVSHRQLGELAGVHRQTGRKALESLEKEGYIRRTGELTDYNSNIYELSYDFLKVSPEHNPIEFLNNGNAQIASEISEISVMLSEKDVFRYRGVAKNGLLLYATLLHCGSASAENLAEYCHINVRTVFRKLNKMQFAGLVMTDSRRLWLANPEPDWDVAANRLSVYGEGKKQKDLHRFERTLFKQNKEKNPRRNGDSK